MAIGERRGNASARRSLQEARLNQIGLVQVFESSAILADRGGDRCDSDRSSAELLDDRREDPAVELVEAVLVHLQAPERFPGTSAKSRSRRSSRLAMRGVPRLREAISLAASAAIGIPRIWAERSTMSVSAAAS